MKHLLPALVVILSITQSGKSMFLVPVQSKGINSKKVQATYMTMNDQTTIAASRSGTHYETDLCILDIYIYTQTPRAYYLMASTSI